MHVGRIPTLRQGPGEGRRVFSLPPPSVEDASCVACSDAVVSSHGGSTRCELGVSGERNMETYGLCRQPFS